MHRAPLVRAIATIAATLGIALAFVAPAAAQSEAPAGNNGHITVDNVAIDDGNENIAHPGCTFVIDLFGYDVGSRTATLAFTGDDGGQLLVDTWTFEVLTRESGTELSASRTVDLSDALVGIAPHPKQGWHVSLAVDVDGAQGGGSKHKTFWVSDCTAEALVASQAAVDLEYDTATWAAAVQANAVAAADAAAVQAAAAAAAAAPADQLPRTGTTTGLLVGMAVALVAAGFLLVRASGRSASAR